MTLTVIHTDQLKHSHQKQEINTEKTKTCDRHWCSCGFFPLERLEGPHQIRGGGGGRGRGEEGRSHMGRSQAAVTWFMFAGWVGVEEEIFVWRSENLLCSFMSQQVAEPLWPKTATNGNPCHQSKGEFAVYFTAKWNLEFFNKELWWWQLCCSILVNPLCGNSASASAAITGRQWNVFSSSEVERKL